MKNVKKIFLLILCCFINISYCYAAAEVNFNFTDPGSLENGEGGNDDGVSSDEFEMSGNYTCSYDYSITPSATITIDGFNKDNISIITGDVTPKESIKAGTSIGISIREVKGVSWDVTNVKVTGGARWQRYYKFTCPSYANVTSAMYQFTEGGYYFTVNRNGLLALEGCSYITSEVRKIPGSGNISANIKNECKTEAESRVKTKAQSYISSSSYIIKLREPNDVDSIVEFEVEAKKTSENSGTNYIRRIYTYTPEYVCINKASAEVSYKNEACSDDEFRISNDIVNDVEHFHYFIPMDVTNGEFSLLLANKGQEEYHGKEWCEKAIDANQYYYDFLFVLSGSKYTRLSDIKAIAKNEVAAGCYVRTEIKIPVSDGYFTIDENKKIDNFNFYFKTINENDPFPNPVTNKNSLWYNWYASNYSGGEYSMNKVAPNILKSYSEIKYLIKNVNANEIRTYNANKNNYNDKSGYLNNSITSLGVSKFIDEFPFTRNNVSRYKLGCGPLNKTAKLSDGTDNPLFQEGCN